MALFQKDVIHVKVSLSLSWPFRHTHSICFKSRLLNSKAVIDKLYEVLGEAKLDGELVGSCLLELRAMHATISLLLSELPFRYGRKKL